MRRSRRADPITPIIHTEAMKAPPSELLVLLGRWLRAKGYGFVTPTPATHSRITSRPGNAVAKNLRDVFGWSLPFAPELLATQALGWMQRADLLQQAGSMLRSRVRSRRWATNSMHTRLFQRLMPMRYFLARTATGLWH